MPGQKWKLVAANRVAQVGQVKKFLAEVDDAGANDRTKGCLAGMREAQKTHGRVYLPRRSYGKDGVNSP